MFAVKKIKSNAEKRRISVLFSKLVSSEKPCEKLGFLVWKHIYFSAWLEKNWVAGEQRKGLGCGLDVISCGTGIVVSADRSLRYSIPRGRVGSGIDNGRKYI